MLNGIAPLIIFRILEKPSDATLNSLSGIPLVKNLVQNFGVPIPIYLDENLTGIFVVDEGKSIELEVEPNASADGSTVKVTQKGIDNTVSINMVARKDSVLLSLFLALCDIIFKKAVSQDYDITYLNGATTVFGGHLKSFNVTQGSDDDLYRITLQLSKAVSKTTKEVEAPTLKNAVRGATP